MLHKMGVLKLDIILGCMFSGKSTELIRRGNRLRAAGKNVLYINHSYDTRTDNSVKTHNNEVEHALKVEKLMPLLQEKCVQQANVICIDEAQFFCDLSDFVHALEYHNKTIIIASLSGDYDRQPFGQALSLIPICDKLDKLNACEMLSCGTVVNAPFTMLIEHKNTGGESSGSKINVGAAEKYRAVSRQTYLRNLV